MDNPVSVIADDGAEVIFVLAAASANLAMFTARES
jgi:hypothetical protein